MECLRRGWGRAGHKEWIPMKRSIPTEDRPKRYPTRGYRGERHNQVCTWEDLGSKVKERNAELGDKLIKFSW